MNPEIERWRKYLRRDPTRFLLDEQANPSVYLWYLIDIAHRPEDSSAVATARERVLYSTPVQELFAAQQPDGYWGDPASLATPRYRATLWNLALLAELGAPRDSRRARQAAEFALQNFLEPDGEFRGLDSVESGYLIHALGYFNLASDPRVRRAAGRLLERATEAGVSDQARVMALWAEQNVALAPEANGAAGPASCDRIVDALLQALADRAEFSPITFPPFDPGDPLLILRVMGNSRGAGDLRLARLVEWVAEKQNESGQWPLEKSHSADLLTRVEEESGASRWATLNAVRVIVKWVLSQARN